MTLDWVYERCVPEPNTGCWLWLGASQPNGYGVAAFGRRGAQRRVIASRLSWELANGPIAPGLYVCHRCDNRPCCNPEHLFLGTLTENNHDMIRKGRHTRGVASPHAKLTAADVLRMREMHALGVSQRELISVFGVSKSQVQRIVRGKKWKHV